MQAHMFTYAIAELFYASKTIAPTKSTVEVKAPITPLEGTHGLKRMHSRRKIVDISPLHFAICELEAHKN